MNHPSNWYNMDYSEQREWKKQQQAIEDAEYDARRAKEDADNEISNARRQAQRDLQEYRNSASSEYEELNECYQEVLEDRYDMLLLLKEIDYRVTGLQMDYEDENGESIGHRIKEIINRMEKK